MRETSAFLAGPGLPYCRGCGHHLVARSTVRALEALGLGPLDVVLVTDIGCHGIVDRCLATHTVHGLHGRSVPLGAGIAMGLPRGKKVVVFIGDGGATIGLQHLLEMARLNVDLTVVVHNNLVYGMTGGQPSGLTPLGYRTAITPDGHALSHHDLCQLVHDSGAPHARRVVGQGDFSAAILEALCVEGFALVEVLELCPAHGARMNPGLRLRDLARQAGYEARTWAGEPRPAFRLAEREGMGSLLDEAAGVAAAFDSSLQGRAAVLLAGSAGEGVQRSAGLFATAAIASGLHVIARGSFPVTVGVGFSSAEVVLSREPIAGPGVSRLDLAVVTSADGLRHELGRIREMAGGTVWLDAGLEPPETGADVRVLDLRERGGPRAAVLYGLMLLARETGVVAPQALVQAVRASPLGERVARGVLEDAVP
jgi:pyruvate/2-oxoacid:ferredoxin oxidoreductase beta subunit/Pyruvate/2-oxoacid:ferredoxin oxidoreductase gamma subunit